MKQSSQKAARPCAERRVFREVCRVFIECELPVHLETRPKCLRAVSGNMLDCRVLYLLTETTSCQLPEFTCYYIFTDWLGDMHKESFQRSLL